MSATIIPFPAARARPSWITPKASADALGLADQINRKLSIKDDRKQLAGEIVAELRHAMMKSYLSF